MKNQNGMLESDMDDETQQLLEKNEQIVKTVARANLTEEERAPIVESLQARIGAVIEKARSQTTTAEEAFEADDGCEAEVETVPTKAKAPVSNVVCLKTFRKEKGWNQQVAAEKLAVSQGLISQVESGRVPMSKKLLAKIEQASKKAA